MILDRCIDCGRPARRADGLDHALCAECVEALAREGAE